MEIQGNPKRSSHKPCLEGIAIEDCCLKFAMFSILGSVKSQQTMAFFDKLRVGGLRADTTLREKNCVSFH